MSRATSQNRLVRGNLVEKQPPLIEVDLGILSKGCFTGLEDKVYGNKYFSINVECISTKGTIYVITGPKLRQLEKMNRIWSQILDATKKNCHSLTDKYRNILTNRSKFPCGQKHATAFDPESQINHRRETTKQPNLALEQKVNRLREETTSNWRQIKVERESRLRSLNSTTTPIDQNSS